jgi:ABC-2 type transport system ATP-binding protein
MNDIEAVCKRLILIDKGHKLFDGSLEDFKNRYEDAYIIRLEFTEFPVWNPLPGYTIQAESGTTWAIRVEKGIGSKEALTTLIELYNLKIVDISVEKQDIEDIVKRIFSHAP